MGTKERILAIRLLDKLYSNPAVAEKVGIIVDFKNTRKQSTAVISVHQTEGQGS